MLAIYVLIIVFGLFIAVCVATEFADIAVMKGYTQRKYFWYTFFLGIVGMLMVVALPDRKNMVTHTGETKPVATCQSEDTTPVQSAINAFIDQSKK